MKLDLQDKASLLRVVVGLAAIILVFLLGIMVISPFLPAIMLALILALATWPAFRWLERKLNHRPVLAASIMTSLLGVFFLIPLIFLGATLVDGFRGFLEATTSAFRNQPVDTPDWARSLPFIGDYADSLWSEFVTDKNRIPALLQEHSGDITQWLLAFSTTIGRGVLDLLLSVIVAFFMFRHGAQTAVRLRILIENFGGSKAVRLLNVSTATLIAVIYGVLGTAVVQGVAAAVGFWITGIPGAPFLGFVTFILSLIPGGPPFVWIPATMWLISENEVGAAIFLGIWGLLIISGVDNILRPYFISLGSDLPILLVLMGVVGGILAFGFIGLFVGPTLLAIAYNIILEWSVMPPGPEKTEIEVTVQTESRGV